MKFETLKDKFNYYRSLTDYKLSANSFVMVMLDGRSFSHKIKKQFKRPFDDDFIEMMNETAKYLCENVVGCKFAYTQSDEITLFLFDANEQEPFFGNRLCKLQSIIASLATSKFNQLALVNKLKDLPCSKDDAVEIIKSSKLYEFDCKAWTVPNTGELFASLLYRQNDCIRNSKQAVAQEYFSPKELKGVSTDKQIKLVKDKFGVDWYTDFDNGKKYGRIVVREIKTLENGVERNRWLIKNAEPFKLEENHEYIFELISKMID